MQNAPVSIEPVSYANAEAAVRFLVDWVSDGEAGARTHLAEHGGTGGASLLAVRDGEAVGLEAVSPLTWRRRWSP